MEKDTYKDAATPRPGREHRVAVTGRRGLQLALAVAVSTAVSGTALAQHDDHEWPVATPVATDMPAVERGSGALQVYADRDGLLAAVNGVKLVSEDFSGALVPESGVRTCYQALGHLSNDPCFVPGELEPGFGMRSSRGSIFDANTFDIDIAALGPGLLGTDGPVVGNNVLDLPYNPTRIDFYPPVTVVGMDAYDGTLGGPVQIDAHGVDGSLIGSFTVQPAAPNQGAFAGMTSTAPIRYVAVNATSDGGGELIGRLLFGGGPGHLDAVDGNGDLGTVAVGSAAAATLQLANQGHLALDAIQLQPLPAPFALTADACSGSTLAAGQTCTVEIGLVGAGPGVHLASWHPAGDGGGAIELRADVVSARLLTAPGHLDFGDVATGSSSTAQSVTVRNGSGGSIDSGLPLVLPAPFSRVGGDCPDTGIALAPGASCQLDIVFHPQTAGDYDSELPVYHGDGGTGGISLSGRGVQGGTP